MKLAPRISKYARFAFRHVRGQDREDLIQETIANAMVAFRRLVRRGRESVAHGSVLAKYAIRQIKDGRRVGSKLRINEMLSKYAQKHKGFPAPLRIDFYDPTEEEWTQRVVEDRTAGPADIACTRIDFSDWLDSLKRRDRRVAEFLAKGETTKATAAKFHVSQGRVSQLRRELAESWHRFVGNDPGPATAA